MRELFDKSSHRKPGACVLMWKKANYWHHKKREREKKKELGAGWRCQRFSQGKSSTQPPAPLFNHAGSDHLSWISGYKPTNKPLENYPPWRVLDVSGKNTQGEKTVKPSKKWEADMLSLSPNGSLSSMCTILVFTKVLRSFVCFNTFQGFVFSGWRRYEFLKVQAMWLSTRGLLQAITWGALNVPWWSNTLSNEPRSVTQMGERVH